MEQYLRVRAEIDLDAARFNMQSMRDRIPAGTKMAGVIKTDGYGHGAVPVAWAIRDLADFFCVATLEEALSLRKHGIRQPILMLGPVPGNTYDAAVLNDIRPSVFTMEQAEALSEAAVRLGREARFHLAVDTGMNRIGTEPDRAHAEEAAAMASLPGLKLEGVFTHLYRADETDLTRAREQVALFRSFLSELEAAGVHPEIRHTENSAGIMELLGADLDMVRAGITLYGIYPSGEVDRSKLALKPVMALKSTVTYVKDVFPGEEISYGGTYRAEKAIRAATIPVGYGDGYPRLLSGKGEVLIAGRRARILGRVCMDQFMADVTDIPGVKAGDTVTLLGKDGEDEITVEELSALCGRFPYEFTCDIGKRVPRVYLKDGRPFASHDCFSELYPDLMHCF